MIRLFIALVFLYLNPLFHISSFSTEKVEYIVDSISQKNGAYIKLLGGSTWHLSSTSLALVADDIVMVFKPYTKKDGKQYEVPIFYNDDEEIVAQHIGGSLVKESGFLVTVVQQFDKGALLKLDDGSILSIPEYDRYHTGWWIPPYKALITGNGLYMWNLKKGKRVWVNGIQ